MNPQVLLYTADFHAATAEVENAGGRLLHVFSSRVFVAELPDDVEPERLDHASPHPPASLNDQERMLAASWHSLQQRQETARVALRAESARTALRWDTPGYTPPDDHRTPQGRALLGLRAAAPVAKSTGTPTSHYLEGKVAVGIITVSGSSWTPITGKLKWVSAGKDGTVWGVNANDDIFRYIGNNEWETIAGKLKQISVGIAEHVWGVNANDDIFQRSGNGWTHIAGKLKNVSVGEDGAVWGVNANDDIFAYEQKRWQRVAGKLKQISVANAKTVWGVNSAGAIFRRSENTWQNIAGGLKHVSAGFDGSVFGVNANDQIFRYLDNKPWQQMSGALKMISAASTSNLWGANAADDIFRGNSSSGLDFALSEITKIMSEVQEGLNFLASAEPLARVTFHYDWKMVSVSVTPGPDPAIPDPYESYEAPFRNAAMDVMGYAASMEGCIDYVKHIKKHLKTKWAFAAFFTKYPVHWFAYQSDVRLVMNYSNGNWGPDNINTVFAHECGHVFGALDEYDDCGCGVSGKYMVQNGNCVNCTSSQEVCLMNNNTLALCGFSRGQIGWSTWSQVPGGLKWVSVGIDGTVWGVNANDDIFRYVGNNEWETIAGKLKQISVGSAKRVWGVNANDDIFQWTGSGWKHITGKLINVSVAHRGFVWGVNAANDIFRYGGFNQWKQIAGKLVQISTGGAGIVWGVNANDDIFHLVKDQWQKIPGKLICVAALDDGTVWGVNRANNIFRYAPATGWTITPGFLKQISTVKYRFIWGVNGANNIFRRIVRATP